MVVIRPSHTSGEPGRRRDRDGADRTAARVHPAPSRDLDAALVAFTVCSGDILDDVSTHTSRNSGHSPSCPTCTIQALRALYSS